MTTSVQEPTLFRTRSMDSAAFILARGHPLVGHEQDEYDRTIFIFDGEASELASEFVNFGQVIASRYFSELRYLKSLVHHAAR